MGTGEVTFINSHHLKPETLNPKQKPAAWDPGSQSCRKRSPASMRQVGGSRV